MFISRIQVQGFQGIGDVTIELGSLSLFVGANCLSVLDAVGLLACASRGDVGSRALDRAGLGSRCVSDAGNRIGLEAAFVRTVYRADFRVAEGSLVFDRETLFADGTACAQRVGAAAWVAAESRPLRFELAEDAGIAPIVYGLRPRGHASAMMRMVADYRVCHARHGAYWESAFAPAARALAELADHDAPRVVGLYGVDRMPGLVGIVREVAELHRERQILWATHRADVARAFANDPRVCVSNV